MGWTRPTRTTRTRQMQYGDGRRLHYPWSAADWRSRSSSSRHPVTGSGEGDRPFRRREPLAPLWCGRREGIMSRSGVRAARIAAVTILAAAGVAACGITSTGTPSTSNNASPTGTPIRIGMSLSLTGDFSADGQASLKGYQLWRDDVNSHGGLLGRP